MNVSKGRARWNLQDDSMMAQAVRFARIPLIITDPNLADNPIVFANDAFVELTGFSEDEVIGKNCRFLQGEDTSPESVDAVRSAIAAQRVETVEILNYRKDGSSFVNALQIGPILDGDGQLMFYFGSQLDVTAKREAEQEARRLADAELIHRLRNIVNVMTVVIRMTATEESDPRMVGKMVAERLRALSDAHFQTIAQPDDQSLSLVDLAQMILRAYAPVGDRQFELSGPRVVLSAHLLSCIALTLHELATNSVKHGALSVPPGRVNLDWAVLPGAGTEILTFRWAESGGPEVVKPERRSGSKIVANLIAAVGGAIEMDWNAAGLIVEARFPV